MPEEFREFFTLASKVDDFQRRIYDVIGDAKSSVECYVKVYNYIISALKWYSRKTRNGLDSTVDGNFLEHSTEIEDADLHFGDLIDQGPAVMFEFVAMVPKKQTGKNAYSLEISLTNQNAALKALRQVRLYKQVEVYNDEYDRQLNYSKENGLPAPLNGNGKIPVHPTTHPIRFDGNNDELITNLKTNAQALTTWITTNYCVQAVEDAKSGELFSLVFDNNLPAPQRVQALNIMLDKVRNAEDGQHEFGMWVISQLEDKDKKDFWKQTKISSAYEAIIGNKSNFDAKPQENLLIYDNFKRLFADFLNRKQYDQESAPEALKRYQDALRFIKDIFTVFASMNGPVFDKFKDLMNQALEKIKTNYDKPHRRLRGVNGKLPKTIDVILRRQLADLVKETADECLAPLDLYVNQGPSRTNVRLLTAPNFKDLKDLLKGKVHRRIGTRQVISPNTTVVVEVDPEEDGQQRYRPMYTSLPVYIDRVYRYYFGFCNMHDLVNEEETSEGIFYYTRVDTAIVRLIVPKLKEDKSQGLTTLLRIDFQNYTIDYTGKEDETKDRKNRSYRQGDSATRFFNELKDITKWKTLKARRRYYPYYNTKFENATFFETHLTGFVEAGWVGTRSLRLGDPKLCLWMWNCSEPDDRQAYKDLGKILGLPESRQIRTGSLDFARTQVTIDDTQYNLVNHDPMRFGSEGFFYQIIGISKPGAKEEELYVQVNTPTPGVASALTDFRGSFGLGKSKWLPDNPKRILNIFNFRYFRRIEGSVQGSVLAPNSKVIQLFGKTDSRKPRGTTKKDDKFDQALTNLPVCFNFKENIEQYFRDNRTRGKIINKGNALYLATAPRRDAGRAMRDIYELLKAPLASSLSRQRLPATAFANNVITHSPSALGDWRSLKRSIVDYLPVKQEWCHLRGHGDGGQEDVGNFVSGSYHCNTEQLAIEIGQRIVTHEKPERTFVLHTTAYLLRDAEPNKRSETLTDNYLSQQTKYQTMLESNTKRRGKLSSDDDLSEHKRKKRKRNRDTDDDEEMDDEKKDDEKDDEMDLITGDPDREVDESRFINRPRQGLVAPVASYLRYKVMRTSGKRARDEEDEKRQKAFDFIFEGQSEFLDIYQSAIISRAVQFALAGFAEFKNWYELEKEELK